jgi:nicotinic acid mononucleotide adenylyltransferase
MNDTELHDLLVSTNSLIHISTTGAGPSLQLDLWSTPGCSQYLVGFFTPYARTQLHGFLGHPPEDSYVAMPVAYDLAMASYIRAAEHKVETGIEGNPVAVGISAAVASTRIPRGDQQAFICVITKDVILETSLVFEKVVGAEARQAQDALISKAARDLLVQALRNDVDTEVVTRNQDLALERFYRYPVFWTDGTRHARTEGGGNSAYMPATLNPIHDGHRAMAAAAEDHLSPRGPGRIKVGYLVSSSSPHKGKLSVQEMLLKAGMLRAERWKMLSRSVEFTHDEPLFIDKARKRPRSVFVIGADTMERMLDPKWGPEIEEMLSELKRLDTKFLVMGRVVNGTFKTCRDFHVPWPHGNLFEPINGRVDLSSTELRRGAAE